MSSTDLCTAKVSVLGTSLELWWLRLSQVLSSWSFTVASRLRAQTEVTDLGSSFIRGMSLQVLPPHPVISVLVLLTLLWQWLCSLTMRTKGGKCLFHLILPGHNPLLREDVAVTGGRRLKQKLLASLLTDLCLASFLVYLPRAAPPIN